MTSYEDLEERPAEPADENFLRRLFLESKETLVASLAGHPLAESLLDMQFRAKQSYYRSAFPNASTRILLLNGAPVGYVMTNNDGRILHIVDIAVLKAYRGRGIGSAVLHELLAMGLPTTLSVELGNPARRLYERLGFCEISRTETDANMRRDPQS